MIQPRNIGIYFNCKHLSDFTWQRLVGNELSLSGTDSSILKLAQYLCIGHKVIFCMDSLVDMKGFSGDYQRVNDLSEAVKVCADNKVDVMILMNRGNDETSRGLSIAETLKVKVILWEHNGPGKSWYKQLAQNASVKRIVCVSSLHANSHRHHKVFNKINYIYNSTKPKFFRVFPEAQKLPYAVCFVGAITQSKGFHLLAKIWKDVKASVPEATLHVYGSGKLYDRNKKLGTLGIAEESFENNYIIPYLGNSADEICKAGVSFLGLKSRNEIESEIGRYWVGVVNPDSKQSFETFCISAIEIQASGTPVIGGNAGGLKETVSDGITGLLINSEKELYEAIVRLLKDERQRLQMGTAARNFIIDRFSDVEVMPKWNAIVEDVVNNRPNKQVSFPFKKASKKHYAKLALSLFKS